MKILYGITKSNFGGAQRYVFDLATEAKKRGYDVKVVCGKKGLLAQKLDEVLIETISLPSMWRDVNVLTDVLSGIKVMKILDIEKPNVFHINSSKMGGIGTFAVRLMNTYWLLTFKKHKTKAVFTSHGWAFNETWRPAWQKFLIKIFAWLTIVFSHATISVSEKTRDDIKNLPFIKHKLPVVKNGLRDFGLLPRDQARKELGVIDNNLLLVGTIGELHRVKGHDILLKAWAKFTPERQVRLVIIGDGEERKNLEKLSEKLGISRSIVFTGYINNASKLLSGLDIYVFPSRSENLPYAVLEAGFASLPTVATSVGGIPEIIEDEASGLLVPKEDSLALLKAMVRLANDPELRKELATNLKSVVREKFSLEKMVEETLSLYQ